jgi:hypothetical protein
MKQKMAILFSYMDKQITIIQKLYKKIEDSVNKGGITEQDTIFRAYYLHNIYSAFEQMFEQVAKTFENNIEDLSKYHILLLKRMNIEIYKIRPQLISDEIFIVLNELRKFRHIFRHGYEYDLDQKRLLEISQQLIDNWAKINNDLTKFKIFLQEQINL